MPAPSCRAQEEESAAARRRSVGMWWAPGSRIESREPNRDDASRGNRKSLSLRRQGTLEIATRRSYSFCGLGGAPGAAIVWSPIRAGRGGLHYAVSLASNDSADSEPSNNSRVSDSLPRNGSIKGIFLI